MAEERLLVYLDGTLAGTLAQNTQGRLSFGYDDAYRTSETSVPLSLSLPKARTSFPPKAVHAFIAGLLPDSEPALLRLGRKYGVSPNNPFALLRHLGRDAAGAVQILSEGESSSDAAVQQADIDWLSTDALEATLTELAHYPETWDPGRDVGRWSLAGAQSKVALFRSADGRWGIPRDSTPTTHILKPSMPGYDGHHLNEHLCLRAAQLAGLPAARTELLAGDRLEVLISHRYDRVQSNGRWRRLHQEDMCQALAVPPGKKYQSDGGPGVRDLAELLTRNSQRESRTDNQQRMFDYLVYNVAIGATDAHAKNFSILLGAGDIRLAPLYDVASILPYDQDPRLRSALKIGDTWELARVSDADWAAVGSKLGMGRDAGVQRARDLRARIPTAIQQAAAETQIPERLRDRAIRIADLVSAHVEERRDAWGRVSGS
jgi:serine/threonine-protein kinase HipA